MVAAASYASAYLFLAPNFGEYNFAMLVGDVLVHQEERNRGIERVKDHMVTHTDAGNVNLLYWHGFFFWNEMPPCALVHILLCLVALYVCSQAGRTPLDTAAEWARKESCTVILKHVKMHYRPSKVKINFVTFHEQVAWDQTTNG